MDASNGAWRSLVILKEGDGIDIMIPVARSSTFNVPTLGPSLESSRISMLPPPVPLDALAMKPIAPSDPKSTFL